MKTPTCPLAHRYNTGREHHPSDASATLIGPLVAIVVGVATASVRDEIGSTIVGVAFATTVTVAALFQPCCRVDDGVRRPRSRSTSSTPSPITHCGSTIRDVVIVALLLGLGSQSAT